MKHTLENKLRNTMTKELRVENPKNKMLKTLEVINRRLETIIALETSTLKTNSQFKWTEEGTVISIDKITNISVLINIYASLKAKKKAYEEAIKDLKLTSYPVFIWQKYTFEDWANDIKIRLSIVSQNDLTKKLKEDKLKLEKFLSEEDQLQATLDDMDYL